jgi:hypothetical protein
LPWGIIHLSNLEMLLTTVERRVAGRRISISSSTARTVRFGENSNTLDDRHRLNATTILRYASLLNAGEMSAPSILIGRGNNRNDTDAIKFVKNFSLKSLKIDEITRSGLPPRLSQTRLKLVFAYSILAHVCTLLLMR